MDSDLIKNLEGLYSAVVADVLDSMGHRHQCLSADIRALTPANRICGRVFTAQAEVINHIPEEPYKLEMAAIDQMKRGDVLVVDVRHDRTSAFWGELLSTACKAKGVRGTVMSGCTRDLWALNQMDFPVFGIGCMPADSKGRADVTAISEPIALDGVMVKTGDYLLGDLDGVVVIPAEAAEEAIRLAMEKIAGENTVREELAAGVPVAEVFAKHGIL
ncbi:MAG: RraA family protein [Verrucomicrobiae bacterium]|nr:RraA family protein [Verrucomicrobiae bacterium]